MEKMKSRRVVIIGVIMILLPILLFLVLLEQIILSENPWIVYGVAAAVMTTVCIGFIVCSYGMSYFDDWSKKEKRMFALSTVLAFTLEGPITTLALVEVFGAPRTIGTWLSLYFVISGFFTIGNLPFLGVDPRRKILGKAWRN